MNRISAAQAPAHLAADQVGGFAIEVYVVAELNEERERRVRIDAQGKSLITGSTALSALAFAATTFVTGREGFELPRLSLWALSITFLAFMVAALCGLRGGGRIHKNQTAPIEIFEHWRNDDAKWFGGRSEASREHLAYIIAYLRQIRTFNSQRAKWLVAGSLAQIVALLGLSLAVATILIGAMYPSASGWHDWLRPPGKATHQRTEILSQAWVGTRRSSDNRFPTPFELRQASRTLPQVPDLSVCGARSGQTKVHLIFMAHESGPRTSRQIPASGMSTVRTTQPCEVGQHPECGSGAIPGVYPGSRLKVNQLTKIATVANSDRTE